MDNNNMMESATDAPRVSVIVCAFNAEETVEATLESLAEQTLDDIEVVVLNDGSTDDSARLIRDFCSTRESFRFIDGEENRGTAYTRQRGLEAARAELAMFVDADDIAEPTLVQTLYDVLTEDAELEAVGCYATYVAGDGRILGLQRVGPENREEFEELYRRRKLIFMSPCSLFRRRSALDVGGYRQKVDFGPPGIRYQDFAEDLDLWSRLAEVRDGRSFMLTLTVPLLRYRKAAASLSTDNVELMQLKMRWIRDCIRRRRSGMSERSIEAFLASRSASERRADQRSDRAAKAYKAAGFNYANGRWFKMAVCLARAFIYSPKFIRRKIATQALRRAAQ